MYFCGEHFYSEHLRSILNFGFIAPNRFSSELIESKSVVSMYEFDRISACNEFFLDVWFWNSSHLPDGFGPNIRFLTLPSNEIVSKSHKARSHHYAHWWYRIWCKGSASLCFSFLFEKPGEGGSVFELIKEDPHMLGLSGVWCGTLVLNQGWFCPLEIFGHICQKLKTFLVAQLGCHRHLVGRA